LYMDDKLKKGVRMVCDQCGFIIATWNYIAVERE
jgi:hypothetical protein